MVGNVIRGLTRVIILAVAVMAHPYPADSQAIANCAERSQVIEFLAQKYHEKPAAVGYINQQAVMEVFAADNGSWTLIVTDVSGRSCVILAGKSWDPMPQVGPKA